MENVSERPLMENSNFSVSLENRNIVSINFEEFIYKTPIKNIRAILRGRLSILALCDIENKSVIIISPHTKDFNFLFIKSLKKGIEDIIVPKSKFELTISKWKEILEKIYGIDKSLDELEELDDKLTRNVIIEKTDLKTHPPLRKGYGKTQADLDNDKKIRQIEILMEQNREAERIKVRKEEKKVYLEKKFGNQYTIEELEKMEEIDIALKANREKETLNDLKKFEKDYHKVMRDMLD